MRLSVKTNRKKVGLVDKQHVKRWSMVEKYWVKIGDNYFEELNADMEKTQKNPLVTVWCLTFNHVEFIHDALEGFLEQKTNFPYEIVIYDDASTDGTTSIIREYSKKFPDIIHAFIAKENTYSKEGWQRNLNEFCKAVFRGKYVALCEGDDCWIDPRKLQIQVDYMEENAECSMYMHNALWMDYANKRLFGGDPFDVTDEGKRLSPEEVIRQKKGHPPTASMLFKKELYGLEQFFFETPIGDFPCQLAALTIGEIYYSSRIMSIYRWKTEGGYSSRTNINTALNTYFNLGLINFLYKYNEYTMGRYYDAIYERILGFAVSLIEGCDNNVSLNECVLMSKGQGYFVSHECNAYLPKLEQLYEKIKTRHYISHDAKKFCMKYEHLIIMGAGKYAALVAEKFNECGIEFDGFAVSSVEHNPNEYMEHPVWHLSEIPFDKSQIGIIVGIIPKDKERIHKALQEAELLNIYYPFVLEL